MEKNKTTVDHLFFLYVKRDEYNNNNKTSQLTSFFQQELILIEPFILFLLLFKEKHCL